jgi:phenylalanyl-tRNA synthetase beta chain
VARDLSAALDLDMGAFDYKQKERMKLGIAREAEIHTEGEMDADLRYKLASIENINANFLLQLRLAMVSVEAEGKLAKILAYVTHTTGVIMRTYNSTAFSNAEEKVVVHVNAKDKGLMEIVGNEKILSLVGASQTEESMSESGPVKLLLEASYIHPDTLVEAVAQSKEKTDELYYKTSRGSNPDLDFGLKFFAYLVDVDSDINCYEGVLAVNAERENAKILIDAEEISSIIGMDIDPNKIITILKKLDFDISIAGDHIIAVTVPLFRHDIKHIQDISEEIVRIIGINNIEAKPLVFAEKQRLNATTDRYKAKKSFRNRAVGAGFYENVSYVFSERALLEKYGFSTLEEALELANPIAEELNTLRSTILVNLLNAAKRNISYSKKTIPLFEIGAIFGSRREQSEKISFIFSGNVEGEHIQNAGKPKMIDFASFTQKVGAVVGTFELLPCTFENGLIHPYQSADIVIDGKVCGFLSKLHPTVQEMFDLPVTFIAELDFDVLLPEHINAAPISKFQGVYKDLSVVIDKSIHYYDVAKVLNGLDLPMLKDSYPVDIYEDEKLGDKKSLTVRFLIQSMERTLEDADIETVMGQIMQTLEQECKAELR